jgi:hypothetical protein
LLIERVWLEAVPGQAVPVARYVSAIGSIAWLPRSTVCIRRHAAGPEAEKKTALVATKSANPSIKMALAALGPAVWARLSSLARNGMEKTIAGFERFSPSNLEIESPATAASNHFAMVPRYTQIK